MSTPRLTQRRVDCGGLREPFVVIDVGVQGGENPRWRFLGDHLILHGFDAIKEAVDDLTRKNKAGSKYLSLARNRQRGRGARVLLQAQQSHQQLVL